MQAPSPASARRLGSLQLRQGVTCSVITSYTVPTGGCLQLAHTAHRLSGIHILSPHWPEDPAGGRCRPVALASSVLLYRPALGIAVVQPEPEQLARPLFVRMEGIEPPVSWSQTRRDAKFRHTLW